MGGPVSFPPSSVSLLHLWGQPHHEGYVCCLDQPFCDDAVLVGHRGEWVGREVVCHEVKTPFVLHLEGRESRQGDITFKIAPF